MLNIETNIESTDLHLVIARGDTLKSNFTKKFFPIPDQVFAFSTNVATRHLQGKSLTSSQQRLANIDLQRHAKVTSDCKHDNENFV